MASEPPLQGIRVVEFSTMVAVPAGAGVLGDWGADVVKVEPPGGEKLRHIAKLTQGKDTPHPPFEGDNRGKRSVELDVKTKEGLEALRALVASADVFISNFRITALQRLGLDPATLLRRHPSLVVAALNAYGTRGPDTDKPGYDVAAFWARSGLSTSYAPEGEAPRVPSNGVGDRISGLTLAGGVAAALLRRARTGRGCIVEGSLLHSGAYANGGLLGAALRSGSVPPYPEPLAPAADPLHQTYAVAGGDFLQLDGAEGDDVLLPGASAALGLLRDERFRTASGRGEHRVECHALLRASLSKRTVAEWASLLALHRVRFAPYQRAVDLLADPQARASGLFADLANGSRTYNTPVAFFDAGARLPTIPREAAPKSGAHTAAALGEAGFDSDRISRVEAASRAKL